MLGNAGSFLDVMQEYACQNSDVSPMLMVHGGAGDLTDNFVPSKLTGVKLAAKIGYETLIRTGSAVEAVQSAVCNMELNPTFNAGYGSVLAANGKVEMDAAIMSGKDLKAGCVSLVHDIYCPVLLARAIMDFAPHRFLVGEGAMMFAKRLGFEILPRGSLVTPYRVEQLRELKKSLRKGITPPSIQFSHGTVGAVAIDRCCNVAAATSSGGIVGKMPGRIGNSAILAGGTYADNGAGCVSATGHGDTFMRFNAAARILSLIQYENRTAHDASRYVLNCMRERFNETGGVISIDRNGCGGIYFTAPRMAWAYQLRNELHYGIDKEQDIVELVDGCDDEEDV